MDPAVTFAIGIASGVIVGAIGGWMAHVFALDRSANERRIADATERVDRCSEMVAARIAYAAAWHRGERWQPLKGERLTLERRHPLDVPAIVLDGAREWENYIDTERRLRHDTVTPAEARAQGIESAGADALALLAKLQTSIRE